MNETEVATAGSTRTVPGLAVRLLAGWRRFGRRMLKASIASLVLLVGVATPLAADEVDDDDDDDDDDGGVIECTVAGEFVVVEPLPGVFVEIYVIEGETVEGDLRVPSGTVCQLLDTIVEGDLQLAPSSDAGIEGGSTVTGDVSAPDDAGLLVEDSSVGGDIECESCLFADVVFSEVGGDVSLEGAFDGTVMFASSFGGDISIEDSSSQPGSVPILVSANTIDGDVELEDNTGADDGSIVVADNTIDGELECEGNSPAPVGGNNDADEKDGQCADL